MPKSEDPAVLDALATALGLHWQAIEFYSAYAAWIAPQYPKLAERIAADAEEERGHARAVMDRLRYFGMPAVFEHQSRAVPTEGYEAFLPDALELETAAADHERAAILTCRAVGDEQSALVFAGLLAGSEQSILEIEATQQTIEEIGLDNYLAAFI